MPGLNSSMFIWITVISVAVVAVISLIITIVNSSKIGTVGDIVEKIAEKVGVETFTNDFESAKLGKAHVDRLTGVNPNATYVSAQPRVGKVISSPVMKKDDKMFWKLPDGSEVDVTPDRDPVVPAPLPISPDSSNPNTDNASAINKSIDLPRAIDVHTFGGNAVEESTENSAVNTKNDGVIALNNKLPTLGNGSTETFKQRFNQKRGNVFN